MSDSFVDFGSDMDGVQEPDLLPTKRYRLRIDNVKEQEKDGVKTGALFTIRALDSGLDNPAPILHTVWYPKADADETKRKNTLLFGKRFFFAFGISMSGGKVDLNSAIGKEADMNVKLSTYTKNDGTEGKKNELDLPPLPKGV